MTSTRISCFRSIRRFVVGLILVSLYSDTLLAAGQSSPELLSPDDRSKIVLSENPVYQWKSVEGASQYIFAIRDLQTRQFIYNPSFNKIPAESICADGICSISSEDAAVMNDYGRYLWRVVAVDESNKKIGASRRFLFVSGNAPMVPVIESPQHNSVHEAQAQPLYQWQASEGAKSYIIRLVDITNSTNRRLAYRVNVPASACNDGTCNYVLPQGLGEGKYRLVVRASNGFDLSKSEVKRFSITPTPGTAVEGYDWSLPEYASNNTQGGLVRDSWPNNEKPEGYTNTSFYSIRWSDIAYTAPTTEGAVGSYDFGTFNWWMGAEDADVKNVLVRLEVNSVCDTPERLREAFNYYAGGSIAFWEEAYLKHLGEFVNAFGSQFATDERIKGVHLGIADGEYKQIQAFLDTPDDKKEGTYEDFLANFCPSADKETFNYYAGDDGWGEFWVSEEELKHAKLQGLTPDNFSASVKQIIDTYVDAFTVDGISYTSKLAFTNLGNFAYNDPNKTVVTDEEIQTFNDIKNDVITAYALDTGVGNRDGLIEDWMSYNNPLYGTGFKPGPGNACYMTLDEALAEQNTHLYSGTENEEYGIAVSEKPLEELDWITDRYGVYEGQPYRFMMSSLRALQMRRNHMQLNTDAMFDMTVGNAILETDLKTSDFLHYLASTMGRDKAETPDAFVVLGERYIRTTPEYVKGYSEGDFSNAEFETCLVTGDESQTPYIQVREFGRWLTEVSGKGTKSNLVDLELGDIHPKTGLKDDDIEPWSIPRYLPEVIVDDVKTSTKYEYSARASHEFHFDINDAVITNRCNTDSLCELEVKVVFQDTLETNLSLVTKAGVVGRITTDGAGATKTATFKVKGSFDNSLENAADFTLLTSSEEDQLPVFMARVNFLNAPE